MDVGILFVSQCERVLPAPESMPIIVKSMSYALNEVASVFTTPSVRSFPALFIAPGKQAPFILAIEHARVHLP